jgi:glycosyltransferase involved in cell wall biosynthesis
MRIAIALKTFPPDVIGGMETQTKHMATELHDAGHEVTVFTKRFGEHDDSDVPYEVARIPNWQLNPFVSDLTFLVFTLLALLRRRKEFDVLQCMMLYPVGFLGYVVNKLTGLPYFAWIRGGDYYLMNDVWWKRWMMRRVLADTLVLAQSEEIRSDVVEDFEDIDSTIDVLGNAVSLPDDTASGDGVLYVGRLAPKKGVRYLLEAVADVDVTLTIVGDGSEREKLETIANETGADVRFEGFVDPDEVAEYYKATEIFVLPSIEGEGMPNAVLEAMAWGLPVITTESGGLPTIIEHGQTGYLVPMRDPDALADAIETLHSDPKKRAEIGAEARRYVRENHSWSSHVDRLESVYDRVVNGSF